MRRVLLMLLGCGLVAACAYVVTLSLSDSEDRPAIEVMPFPRTSKPLPVPEVRIGSGPWADPLPAPTAAPLPPPQVSKSTEGLKCGMVYSSDAKGRGGQFRVCRTN